MQSHSNSRPVKMSLLLGAMGVVYGDIGTSPLYAFRTIFTSSGLEPGVLTNVLSILSAVFWSIALIVTVKYIWIVLRADNDGEGGVLSLTQLVLSRISGASAPTLAVLGLAGCALFFGDGVITPAISVLSAIEGLELAAPDMASLVVPISLGILIALFAIQKKGSGKIGRAFGPIMLLWFVSLAVLGCMAIVHAPQVLAAVNPMYALSLMEAHPLLALTIFGAVFLCVTGGEALYADLGHFGRPAIARAWFLVVWPSLLLNYFGQGALVLLDPAAVRNPFYLLAPPVLMIPLVLLAAMATVIASQAVITGVFSIARQCQLLGYLPRMRIVQSSADSIGQVYVPFVSGVLCLSTLLLVLGFSTADNLSGAYGVGISITMLIDTILMLSLLSVAPMRWRRLQIAALAVVLLVELLFVAGNLPKLPSGGWFPLLFGGALLVIMLTWQKGRKAVARRTAREELTTAQFKALLEKHRPQLVDRTVIFLCSKAELIPRTLVRNIRTNGILHAQTIVMTVQVAAVPRVALGARTRVTEVLPHLYRVIARVGFMDQLDVPVLLREAQRLRKDLNTKHAVYVIGHDAIVTTGSSTLLRPQKLLFALMSRNEALAGDHFGIAAHSIVESGGQVEI